MSNKRKYYKGRYSKKRKFFQRTKITLKTILCAGCAALFLWQLAGAVKEDILDVPEVIEENNKLLKEDNVVKISMILGKSLERDIVNINNGGNTTNLEENSHNYVGEAALNQSELNEIHRIYADNKEILVLVNSGNPFNDEKVKLVSICKGRIKVAKTMHEDLKKMLKAADEEGYSYWIASGYRNWEKQQQLVNEDVLKYKRNGMTEGEALARTMQETALPGYSEHETGLAVDILCSDNSKMDISQEDCPGNLWLQQHCSEYGFILRYPEGKEDVTKFSYEPWHFRYVGKDAAQFITQYNLTLEEFHEILS